MRSKKSEECVVASFLLRKLAPDALPHLTASEEPDFLTKVDQKDFGIEVRSLRDGLVSGADTLAATEGVQEAVVSKAEGMYHRRGLPAALVYVVWKPSGSRRRDKNAIAEALVEAVRVAVATPIPDSGFAACRLDATGFQGTDVAAVHIYRSNVTKCASWFSMRGGWAVPLSPEAIQKALDDKEAKLTSYRRKADVVWLALTVLGTASSKFLVSEATVQTRYRSSFDRIFIVDLSREQVHELWGETALPGKAVPAAAKRRAADR
jgi:hypothetical protein